ncbi:arsenite efflux transporter metallochaperone ArsD [Vibrio sp. SS-MA-C1-2]|uniref:arsenite efflux transporter metallochaperone ArsD n=1 Tax=Vibrio sp. SS-MA-C1-2 TaxID=2908646 RepID=UPI001F284E7A|nr:arsenite efflux transporter metallochaperone ArsD [Vibrio sp. SS-MA-C1-2]UJF17910.1 arsenite efflux transporter metallochaperone ArsD [Vibrio sp. SS-MA-C1-2]
MKSITIYDPSMCCSSGVCGTDLDQKLVEFSANFSWLKEQGSDIKRINLAQEPMAFVENSAVAAYLELMGEEGLPLTLVDGHVALTERYPNRKELAKWADIELVEEEKKPSSCCKSTGCC